MLRFLVVSLTVALFVLKLIGMFDHSWWLVFSPILVYIGLSILLMIGMLAVTIITHK